MGYSRSEEDFLGAYTAYKLKNGGEPVITKSELKSVLEKFTKSIFYMNNLSQIKKFEFDNIEKLAENYFKKASINCSWQKPCFKVVDGKLYPTYDFYDISGTTYGEFLAFLSDGRYPTFTKHNIHKNNIEINKDYIHQAKLVAGFLTKHFAKKYIEKEIENGRWPNHMDNINFLLKKDLGSVLKLKGTKKYFLEFYNHVANAIAILLTINDGKLMLSDKTQGDLKYNNLKRILNKFPMLDKLCGEYYQKNESKFDIIIDGENIKCQNTQLKYHDPYDDDDTFSFNEINLK